MPTWQSTEDHRDRRDATPFPEEFQGSGLTHEKSVPGGNMAPEPPRYLDTNEVGWLKGGQGKVCVGARVCSVYAYGDRWQMALTLWVGIRAAKKTKTETKPEHSVKVEFQMNKKWCVGLSLSHILQILPIWTAQTYPKNVFVFTWNSNILC